jgi:hypothetical protein
MTVTDVTSTNGAGDPLGKLAIGDTFSVTFSNPLPSLITTNSTITLCGGSSSFFGSTCGGNNSTNIIISGLSVPAGFTVPGVYEASSHTSNASGTLALSNGNKTVKFTDTGTPSGTHLATGSAVKFTFVPNSSIKDTLGTAASGSYTTPSAIQLF